MSTLKSEYMYVAYRPCGKISAACWDDAGYEAQTSNTIAAYIKRGDVVKRVKRTYGDEISDKENWMCLVCRGQPCQN